MDRLLTNIRPDRLVRPASIGNYPRIFLLERNASKECYPNVFEIPGGKEEAVRWAAIRLSYVMHVQISRSITLSTAPGIWTSTSVQ